jgi:hypothetical protein
MRPQVIDVIHLIPRRPLEAWTDASVLPSKKNHPGRDPQEIGRGRQGHTANTTKRNTVILSAAKDLNGSKFSSQRYSQMRQSRDGS